MKVRDLINRLLDCPMDFEVVVQKNYGDGFIHHDLVLQVSGNPGHSGPVIHLGNEVADIQKAECKHLEHRGICLRCGKKVLSV